MLLASTLFFAGCICICGDTGLPQRTGTIYALAMLGVSLFGAGFVALFGFCLYRMVRQIAFAPTKNRISAICAGDHNRKPGQSANFETEDATEKYRFVDKIPEYKVMLEQWMDAEKPYMNQNFKLLDVMQALPLNRSYLSRMFNDAYGESFFSFVMRYRLQESVRLLESRPDLTIARIAQICGFSSASVFGRAFLKNKGLTPKEYRKSISSAA